MIYGCLNKKTQADYDLLTAAIEQAMMVAKLLQDLTCQHKSQDYYAQTTVDVLEKRREFIRNQTASLDLSSGKERTNNM